MIVLGLRKYNLHIPSGQSLKAKRQILRKAKDRIRNDFHVSVAEIDGNDLWQRSVLAVALVASQERQVWSILDQISDKLHDIGGLEVLNEETDCLRYNSEEELN